MFECLFNMFSQIISVLRYTHLLYAYSTLNFYINVAKCYTKIKFYLT